MQGLARVEIAVQEETGSVFSQSGLIEKYIRFEPRGTSESSCVTLHLRAYSNANSNLSLMFFDSLRAMATFDTLVASNLVVLERLFFA